MRATEAVMAVFMLAGALGGQATAQGPLAPPGAPGPVMKSLAQVEPRTILSMTSMPVTLTQPGSYYLGGNVLATGAASAIVIATNGVTVDLNGFTLNGAGFAAHGIRGSDSLLCGVEIRNGFICNWGQDGIYLPQANGGALRDLILDTNTMNGAVMGSNTLVEGCVFLRNGNIGLIVGDGSLVRRCVAYRDSGNGIQGSNRVQIVECIAQANRAIGFACGHGARISTCMAVSNLFDGITVGNDCFINRNLCLYNAFFYASDSAIYAQSNNVIDENHLLYNYRAFYLDGTNNLVLRTSRLGNTVASYAYQPTNWIPPNTTANPWGNPE